MKGLVKLLGFAWIKNHRVRKVVRLVANVGIVLASQTPAGAVILSIVGVTTPTEAASVATAGVALFEAVRGELKAAEYKK